MASFFDRFKTPSKQVTIPKRPAVIRSLPPSGVSSVNSQWYMSYRNIFTSPNANIRAQLPAARDAARKLASRDPFMVRYLDYLTVYVIGDSGMQLVPNAVDRDGNADTEANDIIRKAWNEWCVNAGFDGRFSFNDLEDLGIKSLGRDGEMLFRVVKGTGVNNRFKFALHPVDPYLLDINYNGPVGNGNHVIMGVEFDGLKRVAYHIWNQYGDSIYGQTGINRVRERVPADEIIFLYEDEYGNSVRGMPFIVPAIPTLFELYDFIGSYLEACTIAAKVPLVLEHTDARADNNSFDPTSALGAMGDEAQPLPSALTDAIAGYQAILEVPFGKTLKALNTPFPSQPIKDTVQVYLMQIAASLGMSYITFTGDSGNDVSATVRHGSQVERDYFRKLQSWVAQGFHHKVYRQWLEASILSGALPFAIQDIQRLSKVTFRGRGYRTVDPSKDLKGYTLAVEYGFMPRSYVAQELGYTDYEEMLRIMQRDNELEKKYGVTLMPFPNRQDTDNTESSDTDQPNEQPS